MVRIYLVGAGPESRTVANLLMDKNPLAEIDLLVEKGFGEIGSKFHGLHIVGYTSAIAAMIPLGMLLLTEVDPLRKARVFAYVEEAKVNGRRWAFKSVISPQATIGSSVVFGEGVLVMPGAVVLDGAKIGSHVFLGANSTVSSDVEIRDFASVFAGAMVGQRSFIGTGALCGMGSITLPGVRVGAWSQVTAGTILRKNLQAGKSTS